MRCLTPTLFGLVLLAGCAGTPEPDIDTYMEEIAVYQLVDPVDAGITACQIIENEELGMIFAVTEPQSGERAVTLGVMTTAVTYLCPEQKQNMQKQIDNYAG